MKFFVIGDVNVDHIYHLLQLPRAGKEIHPVRAVMAPGGSGGTMAVTLARLGHTVTLASCVGSDPFAQFALSEVRASGVLETALQTSSEAETSTITVLQTRNEGRAMISQGGANRFLNPAKLKKKDIEASDAVIISAYSLVEGSQREYTLKAIEYAKKAKTPVPLFIDLGTGAVDKAGRRLMDDVAQADYLTLNQHEILALTGTTSISAALTTLTDEGMQHVAVKVGEMGCIVWTPGETELVDAVLPQDETALDSTGAGDTFTAVFAHAVMGGQPMRVAAKMANAAGGLASTRLGAQTRHIIPEDLAPYAVTVPARS